MKKSLICLVLTIVTFGAASAQSNAYQTLREKFQGSPNVVSFSASGFLARTVAWMSGEDELREATQDVRKVRFSVIPSAAFRSHHVSVKGFRNLAKKDGFEDLAHVKDGKDDIWLMLQGPESKDDNRYLLIVDSDSEVVVAEVTGFIDPNVLFKDKKRISYK